VTAIPFTVAASGSVLIRFGGDPLMKKRDQMDLFDGAPSLPEGFVYRSEFVTGAEERALVRWAEGLPFEKFAFHGHVGKRRVVSFGWRYDFEGGGLRKADEEMPAILLPLRERAAALAGSGTSSFQHVLVTEYAAGAGIGWHRDKRVFDRVVGISLGSGCDFRLRRAKGTGWERATVVAEARSAYLLSGPARWEWEHSILAVEQLRYSITFRELREGT
jgi:alkylated DNA repair dioxygenase AlkB